MTRSLMGLDLSLTSTGVATPVGTCTLEAKKRRGEPRLAWLRDQVLGLAHDFHVELVVMEGYSYNSKANREVMGELGGVVKVALYEHGVPFVVVPPAKLKTYATGKGNAKKDHMLSAAVHRSGIEFSGNDEADAWWLWALGMDAYGEAPVQLPVTHRRVVDSIEWPRLGVTV